MLTTKQLTYSYRTKRFDIDIESYIGETFGKQNFAKDSLNISVVKDWSDIVEGWFYGQYETGPWWASHSKVDHDNSNGDIVLQLAEVKDGFEDFEDLNNSGWSTWYFRLGGGRGWNAR